MGCYLVVWGISQIPPENRPSLPKVDFASWFDKPSLEEREVCAYVSANVDKYLPKYIVQNGILYSGGQARYYKDGKWVVSLNVLASSGSYSMFIVFYEKSQIIDVFSYDVYDKDYWKRNGDKKSPIMDLTYKQLYYWIEGVQN
jgi:hypothetical protein